MKLLFIPHVPNRTLVNRVYAFAKATDSYFLTWEMDNSSLKHKIISQLRSFRFRQNGKMVQIPLLFKPEQFATTFNTHNLNTLIDKLHIDAVLNANALLFDIQKIKVPVIYDLVDDHLEENSSIGLSANRVKKIKEDIKNATGVLCVTHLLEKKVRDMGLHRNTVTIENGVYIEKFRNAKSLKKELGIEGKKVFGFIGGIERWTGIDKAIEQYLKIKMPDTAMLVVGGNNGAFYRSLVTRYSRDVLFVGRVRPDKVAPYFKTIDVGLIPFELNDFTHNALPIKALEYALSGAHVISTPLNGLKEKNFPFITFCEIDTFAACMQKEYEKVKFDFSELSWDEQSKKLLAFVEKNI